jgi:hypothetical protein
LLPQGGIQHDVFGLAAPARRLASPSEIDDHCANDAGGIGDDVLPDLDRNHRSADQLEQRFALQRSRVQERHRAVLAQSRLRQPVEVVVLQMEPLPNCLLIALPGCCQQHDWL